MGFTLEMHAQQTDHEIGVAESAPAHWYALWTHSHCEQRVYEQLVARGFHAFFPKVVVWSRYRGLRGLTGAPMFPGYLFLHHAMDKISYIEVRKVRGLVGILGERWDRLAVVPEAEVESIQAVMQTSLPVMPHPYLRKGQRVRITNGPLASVEGILVRTEPNKGRFVLSVDLLQRSVAVEVDCTLVVAA